MRPNRYKISSPSDIMCRCWKCSPSSTATVTFWTSFSIGSSAHQRARPSPKAFYTEDAVAAKDHLYRALDKVIEHKEALEQHLARRWQDLFGAKCDLLLYDLTSTYFEGQAGEVPLARHGYSRDHRPDALQLILALVVTEEGFPLSYEVFEGNRADVATLEEILDSVQRKHGALGRIWVFDRGIVSEENLALLRQRGLFYLVATPRRMPQGRKPSATATS